MTTNANEYGKMFHPPMPSGTEILAMGFAEGDDVFELRETAEWYVKRPVPGNGQRLYRTYVATLHVASSGERP